MANFQLEVMNVKKQVAELQRQSSSQPQDDPAALDLISQRARSSVASTEVPAEENALTNDAPAPATEVYLKHSTMGI